LITAPTPPRSFDEASSCRPATSRHACNRLMASGTLVPDSRAGAAPPGEERRPSTASPRSLAGPQDSLTNSFAGANYQASGSVVESLNHRRPTTRSSRLRRGAESDAPTADNERIDLLRRDAVEEDVGT
jgi:hypothetical protein